LARDPTDIELESIARPGPSYWSKDLESDIEYFGPTGKKFIKNLLKSTIAKATDNCEKNGAQRLCR